MTPSESTVHGTSGKLSPPLRNLIVLLAYLLLSAVYTYPLIVRMNTMLPIDNTGINDQFIFVWNIWWTKTALLAHRNPFFTDYIYYPFGTNLAFHTFSFVYNLMALFMSALSFGKLKLIPSYNLLVLWSFTAAGFFQYLLMRQLRTSRKAAFCGGVIFSFSAAHLSMVPRFHNLCMEFLPLVLFFCYRWLESRKLRHLIAIACLMSVLLYNSFVYFFIMVIILIPAFGFHVIKKRISIDGKLLKHFAVACAVFGALSLPLLAGIVGDLANREVAVERFPFYIGADLANYLLPSADHTLFKSIGFLLRKTSQAEFWGELFLTYSLLLSVAISVVLVNKKRNIFWLILALSSLLLSFGLYMTWNGTPIVNLPMPFAWFVIIAPFFRMFRYPMIFVVPLLMALAVIVGTAMDVYWARIPARKWRWLFPVPFVITSLIFVEGLKLPIRLTRPSVPDIYAELLGDDSEYGVLEWPLVSSIPLSRSVLYYQTFHERKLVTVATHTGIFPRSKSKTTQLIMDSPFYRFADSPDTFLPLTPAARRSIIGIDSRFFRESRIKYLVVHFEDIDEAQREPLMLFIREHEPVRETQRGGIYLFQFYR